MENLKSQLNLRHDQISSPVWNSKSALPLFTCDQNSCGNFFRKSKGTEYTTFSAVYLEREGTLFHFQDYLKT